MTKPLYLIISAMLTTQSFAGPGWNIIITNNTTEPVVAQELPSYSNCWYPKELQGNGILISPKSVKTVYTEEKNSLSCRVDAKVPIFGGDIVDKFQKFRLYTINGIDLGTTFELRAYYDTNNYANAYRLAKNDIKNPQDFPERNFEIKTQKSMSAIYDTVKLNINVDGAEAGKMYPTYLVWD